MQEGKSKVQKTHTAIQQERIPCGGDQQGEEETAEITARKREKKQKPAGENNKEGENTIIDRGRTL